MSEIIWKRMIYHGKDLGDFYLVSNTGEIKGVKTGKIRKKNINHEGYYFVVISLGSRENKPLIKIHRAVAETFIGNPNDLPVINHKDGNKLNNNVENLEFCTYRYNAKHAVQIGLMTNEHCFVPIRCKNTSEVFPSITKAAKWCHCAVGTIRNYLFYIKNPGHAGKHPETGEYLQWELVK